MNHTTQKQALMRRLKIIEGQVRGLQKMVEEEKYCVDIITQTQAVRQALSAIEDSLLEKHISTHVIEQMRQGSHKKAANELVMIYQLSKKK